jgi:hypothetical protein
MLPQVVMCANCCTAVHVLELVCMADVQACATSAPSGSTSKAQGIYKSCKDDNQLQMLFASGHRQQQQQQQWQGT